MKPGYLEQRKHIRISFQKKSRLAATLERAGESGQIPCTIPGLSLGGIQASAEIQFSLQRGDRLILRELLKGSVTLAEEPAELEVGWAMEETDTDRVTFGCRFVSLPETLRDVLINIIENELTR